VNNAEQQTVDAFAIELWMVSSIAGLLDVEPDLIDVTEPFANLGLTSKEGVQLATGLEQWLGFELPPTLIFDHPTIQRAARFLAQRRR
jgi:acyl carrier protein